MPFAISNGGTTNTGQIVGLTAASPSIFKVDTTLVPNAFDGGTLNVAGQNFVVQQNSFQNVAVTNNNATLLFVLRDDDRPDGTTIGLPDQTKVAEAFAPAYVLPVSDAGTSQTNLTFIANLAGNDSASVRAGWHFDAVADEGNTQFWTVYVRGAFQATTDADSDPNDEGATLGIVDDINGQGANIYKEALSSGEFTVDETHGKSEGYTVAHEIGHLFNGLHTDGCPSGPCADAGLMAQTVLRVSPKFNGVTLNKIRSINHP